MNGNPHRCYFGSQRLVCLPHAQPRLESPVMQFDMGALAADWVQDRRRLGARVDRILCRAHPVTWPPNAYPEKCRSERMVGDTDNDGQTAHRPGNGTTTTRTSGPLRAAEVNTTGGFNEPPVSSPPPPAAELPAWVVTRHRAKKAPAVGNDAVTPAGRPNRLIKPGYVQSYSERVRLASTPCVYVYALSPPTCESQYVVGSVKNSPCLQRGRIASSWTLMPRPGPVGTGM